CSTSRMNKQGCVFYLRMQGCVFYLRLMNKQGCVFYLRLMNKLRCVFYLPNEQAGMRVLPKNAGSAQVLPAPHEQAG
ncbi:MAG: hypothetical protein ACPGWR_29000, partial [Ardenticatenaceae bacterium]